LPANGFVDARSRALRMNGELIVVIGARLSLERLAESATP
jgi:hypothetical protein